jgi:Nif11 domain
MSVQSVTQFLERVETDEQLQEELAQITESAANSATDGADRQGATELGKNMALISPPKNCGQKSKTAKTNSRNVKVVVN